MEPTAPDIHKSSPPSLPIIDLSRFTSPHTSQSQRLTLAKDLVKACHETGFVYITNHGISSSYLEEAFAWTKRFHELPHEEKMQAAHPENSQEFRGYSPPGTEDVGSLDPWAARPDGGKPAAKDSPEEEKGILDLTATYSIGSDSNDAEPNVWLPPSTLPGFRAFMAAFYEDLWTTSQNILRALALGLGLEDEEYLLRFHTGHENELALRYYPPVKESALMREGVRRLSPHTDFDSLTLLFQDECGGLEVQKVGRKGEFFPVQPVEGALVLNIGDVLMRWSNDHLISTIHRVHLPPLQDRYTGEERMTRGRYSIPYFVSPKRDTLMECLPACQGRDNPPKYEPMLFSDYYAERVSQYFKN